MTRFLLLAAVFLAVSAQTSPLASVQAELRAITAEVDEVQAHNLRLKTRSRLPDWVMVAVGKVEAAAKAALAESQLIVIAGPAKPPPPVTATSCTPTGIDTAAELDAALDALVTSQVAGQTVCLDAGSFSFTTRVVQSGTLPPNTTVMGQGSQSTTGGGDATIISDGYVGSGGLLNFYPASTGVFRLTGVTIRATSNSTAKANGLTYFEGLDGPSTIRIDHAHIDNLTNSIGVNPIWLDTGIYGVIHYNIIDLYNNSAIYISNGSGVGGQGDEIWAEATGLGGADFIFLEDNLIRSGTDAPCRYGDMSGGGKIVSRFNTISGCGPVEHHATGHGADDRGPRATESYGNRWQVTPGLAVPPANMQQYTSGTGVTWGNVAESESLKGGITFDVVRRTSNTYQQQAHPDGWGHAGPGPYSTGVVDVDATGLIVTRVSGSSFNTSDWGGSAGWNIIIAGAACNDPSTSPGAGTACPIASVASGNQLTLEFSAGGALNDVAFQVGSEWDGNTDNTGYPAIDQPGRGQGQLLTGAMPSKLNNVTKTRAWPNQALEPIYTWNLTITPATGYGGSVYGNISAGLIQADRDYYAQASGVQTAANTPFDGTTGTGWGPRAQMDLVDKGAPGGDICTDGVGFFVTDEGSWNGSTSNPYGVQQSGADGRLYKCASNAWVLYYTPYTYPYPVP
jgi:hypothetical protein